MGNRGHIVRGLLPRIKCCLRGVLLAVEHNAVSGGGWAILLASLTLVSCNETNSPATQAESIVHKVEQVFEAGRAQEKDLQFLVQSLSDRRPVARHQCPPENRPLWDDINSKSNSGVRVRDIALRFLSRFQAEGSRALLDRLGDFVDRRDDSASWSHKEGRYLQTYLGALAELHARDLMRNDVVPEVALVVRCRNGADALLLSWERSSEIVVGHVAKRELRRLQTVGSVEVEVTPENLKAIAKVLAGFVQQGRGEGGGRRSSEDP